MDGLMQDFIVTFAQVKPYRQAGTEVINEANGTSGQDKTSSSMAGAGIEPRSKAQEPRLLDWINPIFCQGILLCQ